MSHPTVGFLHLASDQTDVGHTAGVATGKRKMTAEERLRHEEKLELRGEKGLDNDFDEDDGKF